MTRFTEGESLAAADNMEERVKRLEEQLYFLEKQLPTTFLQGRLRTDYTTAPTSSTNVDVNTDKIYDYIILPTAEYILINNSGTLAWRMITLSSF